MADALALAVLFQTCFPQRQKSAMINKQPRDKAKRMSQPPTSIPTTDDLVEFLLKVPGFRDAPPRALRVACERATVETYNRGDVVIQAGADGHALHVIHSGFLWVGSEFDDDNFHRIQIGPKQVVGEMGFLTNAPRSRTVEAATQAITITWTRTELVALLSIHPPLACFLSDILADRLGKSSDARLGKYHILEKCNRGGMSVVFRAHHAGLGRTIAIKMLNHALVFDKVFRTQFVHEAQAIAGLSHPNIVTVFDIESEFATFFMIMEFVEGNTLRGIQNNPAQCERFSPLGLLLQLARALEHSHSVGIAHGDVKPENCLVGNDGTLKLADFGICHEFEGNRDAQALGMISGTPEYMAPEMANGRTPSVASDIYSFALIAYELLAKIRPFKGRTMQAFFETAVVERPAPIETLCKSLPTEVATWINEALDPSYRKRPKNLARFISLVQPLVSKDSGDGMRQRTMIFDYPASAEQAVHRLLGDLVTKLKELDHVQVESVLDSQRVVSQFSTTPEEPSHTRMTAADRLRWLYDD